MIRVLVADDHDIVRNGVRFLLQQEAGMEVVAEALDGRQAVQLAVERRPDVAILDIAMPLRRQESFCSACTPRSS